MSNGEILLRPPPGFWTPPEWRELYFRTAPVLLPIEGSGGMDHQPKGEQQCDGPKPQALAKASGYVMVFGKPVMLPAKLMRKQQTGL